MNDKTKKKDLPGNLNKTELDVLLESLSSGKRLKLLKKRLAEMDKELEKDMEPGIFPQEGIPPAGSYRKKRKDGDVISGGKVLPKMEAAKGGMVKKYMGGGSVHKKKNTMATTKGWGISRKT